ncbi:hypothetical protein AGIG_G18999 [Arapaima gigas]
MFPGGPVSALLSLGTCGATTRWLAAGSLPVTDPLGRSRTAGYYSSQHGRLQPWGCPLTELHSYVAICNITVTATSPGAAADSLPSQFVYIFEPEPTRHRRYAGVA